MELLELSGWLGSILLALCAVPEVISAFITKKCGLTWGFLLIWYIGEWLTFFPVMIYIKTPFLIFNYGLNILLITYLIYIKVRQNGNKKSIL